MTLALTLAFAIQFTPAQARQGEALYAKSCAICHGGGLTAGTAPPLTGPDFQAKYTVAGLLDAIRRMPPNSTRRPPAEDFAIAAFLLERNGHPATAKELAAGSPDPLATKPARAPEPAAPAFVAGNPAGAPAAGSGPTQEELNRAGSNARDWLYHTHDYSGTRHSPAKLITPRNAASLRVACAFQAGELSNFQTGPLVHEGRLYFTTLHSTFAIDARNCDLLWKYEWRPRDKIVWPMNRGIALKDGYAIRGTPDGYLLALNARTGALVWARQVARPALGETFTMPPLVFEDRVIIGPAPSEAGISGWVGAFSLKDGSPLWRFHTIPAAGEPGADTWANLPGIRPAGGGLWTAMSLDPATGELHVAVTNPVPDLPARLRPGANLYTNSLLVLDVRTGKYLWHKQVVTNDSHDWDLTQVSPVFQAPAAGKTRRLIAAVGKDGMLNLIDRQTHEPVSRTPVTTMENHDVPVTPQGVHACPGVFGGVQWNGPAFDPALNRLFVPAVDWCATFTAMTDEQFRAARGPAAIMGGRVESDTAKRGWLTAIDVATGTVAWKYESPEPMVAAVTTTAGGVVFAAELTGHFVALDARTGAVLHKLQTGGAIGGGIVSYTIEGRQYVAVASGRPSQFLTGKHPGSPVIFILTLP